MSRCTILVGGDIAPMNRDLPLFREGAAAALFNDLLPEFAAADFSVINLECPLIDAASPIAKVGPNLGAPPDCIRALKNAGIRAACLANNHVMDHGPQGLRRTIQACAEQGIHTFGAGPNLTEAGQLLIENLGGLRVAFLGMAEREFSIAGRDAWGANPLDTIDFCRAVPAAKGRYDRLIVLVHGGIEHYPYPSPRFQKTCRFLVEQGANAVICQHTHCPGAWEYYRGAPIVYGQGNLVFDLPGMAPSWHEGYLARLLLDAASPEVAVEIIPYEQSREGVGARRMPPAEEAAFRGELAKRASALGNPEELERLWREFCETRKASYFSDLRGHGRLLRGLNRRLRFAERGLSRQSLLVLLNRLQCDAHREAVETILEQSAAARKNP
jgi:hypothetical protein